MGCNSIKTARSHSSPALISANPLKNACETASVSPRIPQNPRKSLRNARFDHKNSLLLRNPEEFSQKSPRSPNKTASNSQFPWRRKSISQLLSEKSSNLEKKQSLIARELEELLRNHAQTSRNLRKLSQNSQNSSKKPAFFYSPLVKDPRKREIREEYGLFERETSKDSVFRKKIKSLFGNFSRKVAENRQNLQENREKIKEKAGISQKSAENRLGWQELNVPLSLNRQQFQRFFEEERDFLRTFSRKPEKSRQTSLSRLLTKASKEKLLEKPRKIETSAEVSQFSARKLQVSKKTEGSSPHNVQKYSANHKESVMITVYSENAEKIQKKLFEKMSLERIFAEGSLKLADGQLKYVKNGRLYVFNLNENVVLHKDKIIQFVRNQENEKKHKQFTQDDLFNFIIKRNLSPTEYFCNEFKRKKFPYNPKK